MSFASKFSSAKENGGGGGGAKGGGGREEMRGGNPTAGTALGVPSSKGSGGYPSQGTSKMGGERRFDAGAESTQAPSNSTGWLLLVFWVPDVISMPGICDLVVG